MKHIYHPFEIRKTVLGTPVSEFGYERNDTCLTLIGAKRLDNFIELIERTKNVLGAIMETGVWKGGACLMAASIKGAKELYVCDSFEGIPKSVLEQDVIDYSGPEWDWLKVPLEDVKAIFKKCRLTNGVHFIKGLFKDTLKDWNKPLSVLRLDGDMYESTMDVLQNCYNHISPGGYIIIDDYAIPPCRQAVLDFRQQNNIENPIEIIDWTGIYWKI